MKFLTTALDAGQRTAWRVCYFGGGGSRLRAVLGRTYPGVTSLSQFACAVQEEEPGDNALNLVNNMGVIRIAPA